MSEGLQETHQPEALLANLEALKELTPEEYGVFFRYLRIEQVTANTVLLKEGSSSREMFFLLEGEISVVRGALQLGRMLAGSHAGELSLITGRLRSATIKAMTDVELAWLSADSFEKLKSEEPVLALKLEQALIRQLGLQLTDITDRFGHLLEERSLPRHVQSTVQLAQRTRQIPTGTPVGECLPASVSGQRVVAALMDRKLVGLLTPVVSDINLEPITTEHWEGQRIFRRSACLLLLEAASQLHPELRLNVALSVGSTQWIQSEEPNGTNWELLAGELQTRMEEMIQTQQAFRHEVWSLEEAMQYFREANRNEALELLQSSARNHITLASCGHFYVFTASPLVPHAGYLEGLRIEAVPKGLMLITALEGPSLKALEAYTQTMKNHTRWLRSLGIHSVGHLNRVAIQGDVKRLTQVAEGFHEKRLSQIADKVADTNGQIRIICIAGPSSSGKTTFIRRLSMQLLVNGLNPVALSLDDYYIDREFTPKDENGEYDFESLYALNLPLLKAHLGQLLAGEQVATARYEFTLGKSLPNGGPLLQLGAKDVLLLEGIHGLNPALFDEGTDLSRIFRIFIQPMASLAIDEHARINPSDLRLLRRIVRDRFQRATTAGDNILRWPSVRAGEQRWIFPFVDHADEVFDSSLVYELQVLKVYAERYLLEIPRDHPAYGTAHRLHQLIQLFVAIYPDHVPQNSILREFIGGA